MSAPKPWERQGTKLAAAAPECKKSSVLEIIAPSGQEISNNPGALAQTAMKNSQSAAVHVSASQNNPTKPGTTTTNTTSTLGTTNSLTGGLNSYSRPYGGGMYGGYGGYGMGGMGGMDFSVCL